MDRFEIQVPEAISYQHHDEAVKLEPGAYMVAPVGAGNIPGSTSPVSYLLTPIDALADPPPLYPVQADLLESWIKEGRVKRV